MRVQILKDFVKLHFPATQLLDYALDVEKITTSKVSERVRVRVRVRLFCSAPQSRTGIKRLQTYK